MYTFNPDKTLLNLKVYTGDDGAEVTISDSQFQRIDRKVGDEVVFQLESGIYGIKVCIGGAFEEKTIHLSRDNTSITFDPLHFASAAPLEMTSRTDIMQTGASQSNSIQEHVQLGNGTGSAIYIFCRDWSSDREKKFRSSQPELHPASGLKLLDRKGNQIIIYDSAFPHNITGDESWSACNVSVAPGIYQLSLDIGEGENLEMNIAACPGWQTQVFLLQRNYGQRRGGRRADLANASIFLARIGYGFRANRYQPISDEPNYRMSEIARQRLTNERFVINPKTINYMLNEKFSSPMLGIYGAHLLLSSNPTETSMVITVVNNLRRILGDQHPDVEALALKTGMGSSYIFSELPMLRRSWSFVLGASVVKPTLVPENSFAISSSQQLWSDGPWLIWGKTGKATDELAQKFYLVTNYLQNDDSKINQNEFFQELQNINLKNDLNFSNIEIKNPDSSSQGITINYDYKYFNSILNNIDPAKKLTLRSTNSLTGNDMQHLVKLIQAPQSVVNSMLDAINKNYGKF